MFVNWSVTSGIDHKKRMDRQRLAWTRFSGSFAAHL